MLHEFIVINREEIIRRCRAKMATRFVPPPTVAEIDHGVPMFLDQLGEALRARQSINPEIGRSAIRHGHDLRREGFTMSQIVHDYGNVCQAITELAMELTATVSTEDFRMLNRCLDEAIASAVSEFGREQDLATLDGESERAGFLAHELRNLLNSAILAFEVLKTGNVGVSGSTGTVLHRSLMGLRSLVERSLDEVRRTRGAQRRDQFLVSELLEELIPAAALEADALGVTLILIPAANAARIEADRHVLAAVIRNLLQNAFKFTRARTTVTLRTVVVEERVLIEVHDECDGLPGQNVHDLFRPFEQRNADRTGLGIGLAFCRWAVEANHGRISARNLPDRGCVFTVDLPLCPVATVATPT